MKADRKSLRIVILGSSTVRVAILALLLLLPALLSSSRTSAAAPSYDGKITVRLVTTPRSGVDFAFQLQNAQFATTPIALAKWGSSGQSNGQFNYPGDVAAMPDGSVLVADSGNHRIQKFSADGTFLAKLGGPGELNLPRGVAVAAI
ncbi:MAG: hypothetical protein ACK2UK_12695 [Candidatus Promineifilaceae bacterium]